jgi:hypothetical protein
MNINIGNLRHTKVGIKCDRTSVLGNPFWMRDESDRDDVCQFHQEYFDLVTRHEYEPKEAIDVILNRYSGAHLVKGWKIPSREEVIAALDRISDGDTILCWCTPKRCHLDTVTQFLEQKHALQY